MIVSTLFDFPKALNETPYKMPGAPLHVVAHTSAVGRTLLYGIIHQVFTRIPNSILTLLKLTDALKHLSRKHSSTLQSTNVRPYHHQSMHKESRSNGYTSVVSACLEGFSVDPNRRVFSQYENELAHKA
jgi:hypothetical protein